MTPHMHLLHLLSYYVHPITNAVSEGLSSCIRAIKADARRFQNQSAQILFYSWNVGFMSDVP